MSELWEPFTEEARRAIVLSQEWAQRFNHGHLDTEHLLLGIIDVGSGVVAHTLERLAIDVRNIRLELMNVIKPGPSVSPTREMVFTDQAKRVIECAFEEARRLNVNYIGTEHLLCGILRVEEGVAAQVLIKLGLKVDDIRSQLFSELQFKRGPEKGYEHAIAALPDDVDYIQHLAHELAAYCSMREERAFAQAVKPKEVGPPSSRDERIDQCKKESDAVKTAQELYDKLKQEMEQQRQELCRGQASQPLPPATILEPVTLSEFARIHLTLFRAEEAFQRDALAEASDLIDGIEAGIHRVFCARLNLIVEQLLSRLDSLLGAFPEKPLQACRADLIRARADGSLGLKERAHLVQQVYAEVGKLVRGRPKLVCKVNVFEHGCRDVLDIGENDTVASLHGLLKEKYSQQIEEYLSGIHQFRIPLSAVCVRVYGDTQASATSDSELDPQTLLSAIPKHDTEGVTWFPELIGADAAAYR